MKRWIAIVLCLILVPVSSAFAQNESEEIHELEEVVVTATHKMKMLDTPASISIITAKELEEMGAKNIVEALRKIPGVDDTSSKDSAISIRGTRSSMAGGPVILIDGVPQKIGDYRYDELSFIPVSQIERIEVLRSAGIAYGPGSARGVINVITKKGIKDKPFSGTVSASYGSWNTHNESAGFSGRTNQWDYFVNAANYSTEGYEDEETDRISGLLKLGYNFSDQTRIGIRGSIIDVDSESAYGMKKKKWQLENYREEKHFPVSETDSTLYWHNEKDQDNSVLALEFSHKKDRLFVDSNLSWTKYEEDYKSTYPLYTSSKSVYYDSKDQDTYTFGVSGGYLFDFGNVSYTPSFGVNFEDIDFDQDRAYPYVPTKNTDKYNIDLDETQYGLFWDNDFLIGQHWGLKIGGRVDKAEVKLKDKASTDIDEDETMFSWVVAPSYRINDRANTYVSVARNYWFPSPRYYVWAAEKGGDLNRPEDLEPEESLTYEIGYKHLFSKALNVNLTAYLTEYDDKFSSAYDADDNYLGQKNIGEAEAKGIELEIDGRLCSFFGYRLSGAYQNIKWKSGQARIRSGIYKGIWDLDGYYIKGIPKFSGVIGLDFYPMEGLKCSADINHTGSKYSDYLNKVKYSSKTTVDVNISYRMNNWEVWLLGKNIFDEEIEAEFNSTGVEDDSYYYVQDGAYVEAGLRYHF